MSDFALDGAQLRRRLQRGAATVRAGNFLARETASRMAERLDLLRNQPQRILDLGCGTGDDLALLAARYPEAQCIGIDFAPTVLSQARPARSLADRLLRRARGPALLCADATALPLARSSVQMLWSNLLLPSFADPLPAFREMHRVLAVEGVLMFATLGPDTLRELRDVMPATHGERVHRFIDMHDLGDTLVAAGFGEPVMDMERLTLTYTRFDDLLRDLRQAAATNVATTRPRGLSGKAGWQQARAAYEKLRVDGRLPATIELVFGHAWKAAPKTMEDGRAVIRFERERRPLRG
ncbi:MAG: methyltransferase domain-containing protein [Moraxellaceae bacterium]|nr:methyltransferase domain-containing protein [Moraxellaceae bacterium]